MRQLSRVAVGVKQYKPQVKRLKVLALRRKILALVTSGVPKGEISQELGLTVRSIDRHMAHVLKTESSFPATLNNDEVNQLRQTQGEGLLKYQRSLDIARERCEQLLISLDEEICVEATKAMSSIAKSYTATAETIARLYGTFVPQKFVSESLQINLERRENKVLISFDASVYDEPAETVPGLQMWNGQESLALPQSEIENAELTP
jgi:hypothetical protein